MQTGLASCRCPESKSRSPQKTKKAAENSATFSRDGVCFWVTPESDQEEVPQMYTSLAEYIAYHLVGDMAI